MKGIPARLPQPGGFLLHLLEKLSGTDRATDFLRHELRTPLTGILGMATLLRESGLKGEQLRFLLALEQSGWQLASLLEKRGEAWTNHGAAIAPTPATFNGLHLLENVTRAHWVPARNRGLGMYLVFDHRLPAFWNTDPVLLRQVLDNLLANAIKFTTDGYVLLEARRSRLDSLRHGLELRVSDTGPGVRSREADEIFALGVRGTDARIASNPGSGYGLYLSRCIAVTLGGALTHCSTGPGGGARFTLQLPSVAPVGAVERERMRPRLLKGLSCEVELPPPLDRVVAHALRRMGISVRLPRPDGCQRLPSEGKVRIGGSPPGCESPGFSSALPQPVLHASLEPLMFRLALDQRMRFQ